MYKEQLLQLAKDALAAQDKHHLTSTTFSVTLTLETEEEVQAAFELMKEHKGVVHSEGGFWHFTYTEKHSGLRGVNTEY
jgi:uncharacterized glyoxalase superfamily protein PhnB